jgi:2'-5' RNA ligase
MRVFVAVDIPAEIREKLQALLATLRRAPADVRWSRPEGLHITLKFLGEVPAGDVERVKTALQTIQFQPVPITISGAGFFPNQRAPRVVWLGVQAGPELGALAAAVEHNLIPLGFAKESRPFSPHLTLGRIRTGNGIDQVRALLKQHEPLQMGSYTAADFFLYESQLSPAGSIYKKLARYPLVPSEPDGSDGAAR